MILVTGATGHLGAATIQHLLKRTPAENIAALVRDEQKATALKEAGVSLRVGSFDDTTSLDSALSGIEKVLLVSGTDPNRFEQHKNVIDAAKRAGVKHIAYTGISMKDVNTSVIADFLKSHFDTEDYIKASGIPYTILRNTLYMDGITGFAGEHVLETGINLPSGDGKVPYALRREMGEAAANVLLQDGHENTTYEITGSELHSYADFARELGELTGKTIDYNAIDATVFRNQLKEIGLPDYVVMIVAGFSEDIAQHQFESVSSDLEKLLGRKPTSLKDGVKELFNAETYA